MDHEASRREAETEIVEAFTSNAGVRAASFEPRVDGGASDVEDGLIARLPSTRASMNAVETYRRTVAHVGSWSKFVIETGYSRSALGAANDLLIAGLRGGELCDLVALAPITERAQRLVRRELGEAKADQAAHAAILRLLEDQAGKGASLITEVREQAAALRDAALDEYAAVRTHRVAAARRARAERIGDLLARKAS